jgi:alcohol dehydrogenase (cytochrome c)
MLIHGSIKPQVRRENRMLRRRALIAGIALAARLAGQKTERNPFTSAADIEAGHKLYNIHCRTCHGANGERADRATKLASTFRRYGSSDHDMFQTISNGASGTGMPGLYSDEESVWKILAFIRTLEASAEHASEAEPAPALRNFPKAPPVTTERLLEAASHPAEWLMYGGDYASHRFSRLGEINQTNVGRLEIKWVFQRRVNTSFETTPLVADGVMYLTAPPNDVYAISTDTGDLIWEYRRAVANRVPACCGQLNRGLTIAGDRLFMATLDAHLVALDRKSGRIIWDTAIADYREGYTATHAPLVIRDKVLAGIAGGEYGIRGFLDAYQVSDGKHVWRTYTVPGPGEFGHETWVGDSWKRGGAPIWLTGSYDPELNLTYWGTGNPGPDWNGEVRRGDNLFSCSVLALDPDTGERKWHFQFTPHDTHDWDAVQAMVLIDHEYGGRNRRLLATANRDGFYYLLDRATGEFLHAQPYVKQTWAAEIDRNGRPVELADAQPREEGVRIYP